CAAGARLRPDPPGLVRHPGAPGRPRPGQPGLGRARPRPFRPQPRRPPLPPRPVRRRRPDHRRRRRAGADPGRRLHGRPDRHGGPGPGPALLGPGAGGHHPALGKRRRRAHPRLHAGASGRLCFLRGGGRADRRVPAAPARPQVARAAGAPAGAARGWPPGLALGSAPAGRVHPRYRGPGGAAGRRLPEHRCAGAAGQRRPQRPGQRRDRGALPGTRAARPSRAAAGGHPHGGRRRQRRFYRYPAGIPARPGHAARGRIRRPPMSILAILAPFFALLLAVLLVAYHRWGLAVFAALAGSLLVVTGLAGANLTATWVAAGLLAVTTLPLLITPLRQALITRHALRFYTKILPPLSETEKTALEAGTVGFEGELFSGMPKWNELLSQPKPELTAEEQAF